MNSKYKIKKNGNSLASCGASGEVMPESYEKPKKQPRHKRKKTNPTKDRKALKHTRVILVIVIILWVATSVILVYDIVNRPKIEADSRELATRSLLLSTDGYWTSIGDTGLTVWVPSDLPAEESKENNDTQLLFVKRDRGNMVDKAFGVMVLDNPDSIVYDAVNDPMNLVTDVRSDLLTAVGNAMKGINTTYSVDTSTDVLGNSVDVVVCDGDLTTTLLMMSSEDVGSTFTEEAKMNLYFNVCVIKDKPVVAWSIWRDGAVKGESTSSASVRDAMLSICEVDKKATNGFMTKVYDLPQKTQQDVSDSEKIPSLLYVTIGDEVYWVYEDDMDYFTFEHEGEEVNYVPEVALDINKLENIDNIEIYEPSGEIKAAYDTKIASALEAADKPIDVDKFTLPTADADKQSTPDDPNASMEPVELLPEDVESSTSSGIPSSSSGSSEDFEGKP